MILPMLILIQHDDDDGNNFDLFVEAANGAEAMRLWREYYELEEFHAPQNMIVVPERTGTPRAISWATLVSTS